MARIAERKFGTSSTSANVGPIDWYTVAACAGSRW
jgi:hypothetical protein